MRCDECGIEQSAVLGTTNTHCAPPFTRQRHSFTGLHPADRLEADQATARKVAKNLSYGKLGVPEPIDTSKLGPVRIDSNERAIRVRVVREALYELAGRDTTDAGEAHYLSSLGRNASPVTLLALAALLK